MGSMAHPETRENRFVFLSGSESESVSAFCFIDPDSDTDSDPEDFMAFVPIFEAEIDYAAAVPRTRFVKLYSSSGVKGFGM
jgi:hypothetical protein